MKQLTKIISLYLQVKRHVAYPLQVKIIIFSCYFSYNRENQVDESWEVCPLTEVVVMIAVQWEQVV